MSRIAISDPQPSQLDPYFFKKSKSLRDRWNHSISTQLYSECFWKHSLRVIKPNKASHCIQRRVKLQVDPLRLTGRYLKSAHAAPHITTQYWSYLCLMQTPSHTGEGHFLESKKPMCLRSENEVAAVTFLRKMVQLYQKAILLQV